jgi:DNA-binding response OmpR family regulator
VLVVEDDLQIATVIAEELRQWGHGVDVVSNRAEALAALAASRPDAIVLDLMLPVVHGWAFIERYREATAGQEIPIIVVSAARAFPGSMEALGVRRFIAKPFELEEVARAVAEVIQVLAPSSLAGLGARESYARSGLTEATPPWSWPPTFIAAWLEVGHQAQHWDTPDHGDTAPSRPCLA